MDTKTCDERILARWLPSGQDGEALAVRIHCPVAGSIARVLIIAPSFGREQVVSTRTLRVMAARAAEKYQTLVLRFAWRGTSESTGALPADPAAAWCEDLTTLVAAARTMAPGVPVVVIGFRLGAAVAFNAAQSYGAKAQEPLPCADHTILWEPVSGSRFLREHKALRRLGLRQTPSRDGVEIPGVLLSAQAASCLKGLKTPQPHESFPAVSVHAYAGADDNPVELAYNVASRDACVPDAEVDSVLRLMNQCTPTPNSGDSQIRLVTETPGYSWPQEWVSAWGTQRCEIMQRFVTIGAHRLPGIVTRPAHSVPRASDQSPAGLLMVAADAEPMDGPTGLWARFAREAAAQGVTVLRADRRTIAEGADCEQLKEPMPYTEEAVEDVGAAIDYLSDNVDGPIAGMGLCSGAWLLLRNAGRCHMQQLMLINNIAWHPDGEYFWRYYRDNAVVKALGGRSALMANPDSWRNTLKESLKGARSAVRRHTPAVVRRLMAQQGWSQYVGQGLKPANNMPPLKLYLGTEDYANFALAGGFKEVSRLHRRGFEFHVEVMGDVDHALLSAHGREHVTHLVSEVLHLNSV